MLRDELMEREERYLSPFATPSREAVRLRSEPRLTTDHRMPFSIDGDRILHSLAYTRYIDKTQVFSLIPNDHITHRVLHVQLVSKIAKTIGRFLRLNEDLIEAIALGHDIGHPPFGHDGERFLSRLCVEHGLPPFVHSVQGVRAMHRLERKGRGCNLTLQVLDGILCHDGELHLQELSPQRGKGFQDHLMEMERKERDPALDLRPMTLEGCLVRMCDVISYIGRDIEDAIRLGLIRREEIPAECRARLGETNGKMVYRLVEDLIENSRGRDAIAFSAEVSGLLLRLRRFNMERIYSNPLIKTQSRKIEGLFETLFRRFLQDLKDGRKESPIFTGFLHGMDRSYREETPPAAVVRDFIAGMTDAYFIRTATELLIPSELPARFD